MRKPRVEVLESRRLLAIEPALVKDINELPGDSGTLDSNPLYLTDVNGTLFFAANDGINWYQLWKTDGTAAGTNLVGDIFPHGMGQLTNCNGTLFFVVDDGFHGTELWKSDGTLEGTTLVKDINSGEDGSAPQPLTSIGDTLYFFADDGVHGRELWKSDGTAEATVLVKDISDGDTYVSEMTDVNGTLFFEASDGDQWELWKSDGTAAGTVFVWDGGFEHGAYLSNLTNVNGTLFFTADALNDQIGLGEELWRSDGTEEGTTLVKNIRPQPGFSSYPGGLTNVEGMLFFFANDGGSANGLWKTDGTELGTVFVKAVNLTSLERRVIDGTFFFFGSSAEGSGLWRSDGTAAGTVLVSNAPPNLPAVSEMLLFGAYDSHHGYEPWLSDGTAAGTALAKDLWPCENSSYPNQFVESGGLFYFSGDNGLTGRELWVYDPAANHPPTAHAGGPYSVSATVPIQFNGSAVDPETPSGNLLFEWDFNHVCGAFNVDTTGATPTVSFATPFTPRTIALRVTDPEGVSYIATSSLEVTAPPATVVARHIFYNNSVFDGNTSANSAQDDAAIAADKSPLLPGATATLANYTSFSKGLNGIMIDLTSHSGTITAADFNFKVGNNNSVASWFVLATLPDVSIRPGAGAGGSERVTLIWPDGVVKKQWLQVTVLANANTGLAAPDVFYFGNAIGEVGNTTANAIVTSADESLIRLNFTTGFNTVPVTSPYDIDKNRFVQTSDAALSRVNQTTAFTALRLIAVPTGVEAGSAAAISDRQSALDSALADLSSTSGSGQSTWPNPATRSRVRPSRTFQTR
jgi:ELWxxDGT repeat protein